MLRTLLFLLISLSIPSTEAWELQKDAKGIQIYTQQVEGSEFKAFRGTTTVNATPHQLLDILMDPESMPEWLHDCKKSELVKKVSDNEYYVYYVTDAPWPVSDRDYVLHSVIEKNARDDSITIQFDAVAELKESTDSCVRVTQIVGHWKFTPQSNTTSLIEYETHADPNGELPSWLANSFVIDQPYETLTNLKQKVENKER